jgi:hypothetical protein
MMRTTELIIMLILIVPQNANDSTQLFNYTSPIHRVSVDIPKHDPYHSIRTCLTRISPALPGENSSHPVNPTSSRLVSRRQMIRIVSLNQNLQFRECRYPRSLIHHFDLSICIATKFPASDMLFLIPHQLSTFLIRRVTPRRNLAFPGCQVCPLVD